MTSLQETIDFDDQTRKAELAKLSTQELMRLAEEAIATKKAMRQERQLFFYEPVSPEARKIHFAKAHEVVIVGGNRSSKTDTVLAEIAMRMTGEIPLSLEADYDKSRVHPPIRVRLVVESLTNTWEPHLKPKLQWQKWDGMDAPWGKRGHWGWIPKDFLIKGSWDESWSEKNRILTLRNGSILQVMSYDQDPRDFASGQFDVIDHDEGPSEAIYRENKQRATEQIFTQFTPPDDESVSWRAAWICDQLYEKGLEGPNKDPQIDSFTLFTEDNRYLTTDYVSHMIRGLTALQKSVRTRGAFIHLSGRIFPSYTDKTERWCFRCNKITMDNPCPECQGTDVAEFCHFIEPLEQAYSWPIVFLIDPHPRKAHHIIWVAVSPWDDNYVVGEMTVDKDDAEETARRVFEYEEEKDLYIAKRLVDPNMALAPAGTMNRRTSTVRDELDAVGLKCDLPDDNRHTGRMRVKALLRPDPRTKAPRLQVFNNCIGVNFMMKHWVFGEWRLWTATQRDPKPIPVEKNSDYPTLLQYFANANLTYSGLYGSRRIMVKGGRKGGY